MEWWNGILEWWNTGLVKVLGYVANPIHVCVKSQSDFELC